MNKPSDKTIAMIKDIFEQGDSRYDDDYSAYLVASFIENKGLEIKKKLIKDKFSPSNEELEEITPPQRYYKFIGKKMLERYGYKVTCFEGRLPAGRADILAKHTHYNQIAAVECHSCRTEKAIKYLEQDNLVLWVMSSPDKACFLNEEIPLFIIQRGPNWNKCLELYKKSLKEMFEKIPDLLDDL